jgi:hypothetical protein
MTDLPPLCDGAAAVTADWMTRALTAGGVIESPRIAEVSVEPLGSSRNALGTLLRCHLVGHDRAAAIPESVIVKLPTSDRLPFRFAKWQLLHKREYDFYTRIAPHLELRTPALLYGHFEARSHRFVLVLEDLRHLECPSQIAGVGAGRAMSAIRAIARLHGRFWESIHRAPVAGCHPVLGGEAGRALQGIYALALPRVLNLFEDQFTPATRRLAQALAPLVARHLAAAAAGPRTFIHGDYRGENMFFGAADPGEFAVIDWQASGIGSGLYDLAYFLAGSVRSEDRRSVESSAIEEYHDIVSGLGAADLTLADCRRSYRRHMLDTLVVHVLGCAGLRSADEEGRRLTSEVMRRVLTAVEDLDAGEFLPERGRAVSIGRIISTVPLRVHGLRSRARRRRRAHGAGSAPGPAPGPM